MLADESCELSLDRFVSAQFASISDFICTTVFAMELFVVGSTYRGYCKLSFHTPL